MPSTEISNVALSNVYRHISERALNCSLPIKEQRRHGFLDSRYVKPIVAKAGMDIAWTPGNHTLRGPARYFPVEYEGAHWANADPCFCVGRRIRDRRDRQSKHNLEKKLTYHHHGITAEDVLKECRDHQNDPMLW